MTLRVLAVLLSSFFTYSFCTASAAQEMVNNCSDWGIGLNSAAERIQGPSGAIRFGADASTSGGGIASFQLIRNMEFVGVANGVPRAEIVFLKPRFKQGETYRISWSTFLPLDYVFDFKQEEIITQIHQETPQFGSPPFAIIVSAGEYKINVLGSTNGRILRASKSAGEVQRGSWANWDLTYTPDSSGARSITTLKLNGTSVAAFDGVSNAYQNDDSAYLKVGIYKWDWLKRPSDVDGRILYVSNVCISKVS